MRGGDGELIRRLLGVLTALPGYLELDAATFIAFAIGGVPMTTSPRPADVVPAFGTIAAKNFIDGHTVELDVYRRMLADRLSQLYRDGVCEDFLVRAVAADVTRQFARLTETSRADAARADFFDKLTSSGRGVSQSMREQLQPSTQAEITLHVEDLQTWTDAQQSALPNEVLDAWLRHNLLRS